MREWPGPDLPPKGGDDAVDVRYWKKATSQAVGRLWVYAYGVQGDKLPDGFRDPLREWYDRVMPLSISSPTAAIDTPPISEELRQACQPVWTAPRD